MTFSIDRIEKLSEGGANAGTHLKIIMNDEKIFGLKLSTRMVLKGTIHEFLAATTARMLNLPGAGLSTLITVPNGIPLLETKQAVLLEWLAGAKKVAEIAKATVAMKSNETAKQLGGWTGLILHFGISDRHLGNWIWSEINHTISAIDFEEWREGIRPQELSNPIRTILGGSISEKMAKSF